MTDAWRKRLVLARQHAGIGSLELARQLGVNRNCVYQWETGARPRDIFGVTQRIADICGVDYVWLLAGD